MNIYKRGSSLSAFSLCLSKIVLEMLKQFHSSIIQIVKTGWRQATYLCDPEE
ncbi:MAG: hypothetical protein J7L54_03905 [Elusimicrobia bacterium]|nr:hypothetical protein [Elusimicrobiota bacterium]